MWTRFHYKHLILLETFKILENKLIKNKKDKGFMLL